MPNSNRKKEILNAAKKLFSRAGYAQTSMDDIASEVKITKASLYYFFESKEEIFADIIREVLASVELRLSKELGICKNDAASFTKMVRGVIDTCLENGIVIRPVDIKMTQISAHAVFGVESSLNNIRKTAREVLKCYKIRNAELATEVLINSLHSYVLHAKNGMPIAPAKEYSEYLASLFLPDIGKARE